MSEYEERVRSLTGDTLDRLTFRLNKIWRAWGPGDYPEDNGIRERNRIFLFADWILYLLREGCSAEPKVPNEWIRQNAPRLVSLDSEALMRCVGIARVHQQSFWWHLHFYENPQRLVDAEEVRRKLRAYGRQLDWITNVHGLSGEVAQAWHKLVVEHLKDGAPYVEASKDLMGSYLVKTKLGWSEASSPDRWDHLACSADLSSGRDLCEDARNSEEICDRVFSNL